MDDKKSISYPLSGADIKTALDNKVKLITYSDLMEYNNIFDVLKPYNKVVILFETSGRLIGHYTCLFKCNSEVTGESIIFFDPYGIKPEKELNFVPDWLKEVTNAKHNLLYRLFQQDEIPIRYNQHDLQKWSKKVSTCGRWSILRLMYPQYDENEFYKFFKDNAKKKDWDIIVTKITNKLF